MKGLLPGVPMALVDKALQQAIADFNARGQLGPDPVGALYAERRKAYSYFTRQMNYFTEEMLFEIRQQIPKTRLEAEKDFFEGKRACDHLEGSYEASVKGEMVPEMTAGQRYWRDAYLPAGLASIITPMNFI